VEAGHHRQFLVILAAVAMHAGGGVGIVAVVRPDITVGAFVILFAVYAFLAAIAGAARAFASDRAGPVAGYLLPALLSIAPAG